MDYSSLIWQGFEFTLTLLDSGKFSYYPVLFLENPRRKSLWWAKSFSMIHTTYLHVIRGKKIIFVSYLYGSLPLQANNRFIASSPVWGKEIFEVKLAGELSDRFEYGFFEEDVLLNFLRCHQCRGFVHRFFSKVFIVLNHAPLQLMITPSLKISHN